ncbi:hypothetical protein ACFWPU_39245 [Streptomyces sp. NPDC058471]|uniref:hypothetical protein n=1 Tax=Streptomyces sp. NPDC058471 TaxID=3346516 RepID=UPI0036559A0F
MPLTETDQLPRDLVGDSLHRHVGQSWRDIPVPQAEPLQGQGGGLGEPCVEGTLVRRAGRNHPGSSVTFGNVLEQLIVRRGPCTANIEEEQDGRLIGAVLNRVQPSADIDRRRREVPRTAVVRGQVQHPATRDPVAGKVNDLRPAIRSVPQLPPALLNADPVRVDHRFADVQSLEMRERHCEFTYPRFDGR